MKFITSTYPSSCAPACLAMLTSRTIEEACLLLRGHYSPKYGTEFRALGRFLEGEGHPVYMLPRGGEDVPFGQLIAVSRRYPVAVAVRQRIKTVAGGTSRNYHCLLLVGGRVWDPARSGPEPVEGVLFSKERKNSVCDFLVLLQELPDWPKNFLEGGFPIPLQGRS